MGRLTGANFVPRAGASEHRAGAHAHYIGDPPVRLRLQCIHYFPCNPFLPDVNTGCRSPDAKEKPRHTQVAGFRLLSIRMIAYVPTNQNVPGMPMDAPLVVSTIRTLLYEALCRTRC